MDQNVGEKNGLQAEGVNLPEKEIKFAFMMQPHYQTHNNKSQWHSRVFVGA